MPVLFRIETDRIFLEWSGPRRHAYQAFVAEPPTGRLSIQARRPGLRFQARTWRADVPEAVAADPRQLAGPRLYEETEYTFLLRLREGRRAEVRHRDPLLRQGLTTSGSVIYGSVRFRSQVGRSRFSIRVDGQPELDFEVEVFPSKLDYEADYKALLTEVQDLMTGMALEYLRSTFRFGVSTAEPARTRLEWLIFLRHVMGDLEKALNYVADRPRRGLRRMEQPVRLERVRRQDSGIRRAVLQGRGLGPRVRLSGDLISRTRLDERRPVPTLDTPEHRWLSMQLSRIRRRLALLRGDELARTGADPASQSTPAPRDTAALKEIDNLERRVARLSRIEPLGAAQGFPPAGFSSLQLQAAPGYAEAYRACLILNLGLRISGGPVELSVKDLHLLYEYWCYLAVVRMASEVLGEAIPAERLLTIEQDGLRVRLKKGREHTIRFGAGGDRTLSVTYNPRFSGQDFLLPQQPDIVLTLESPAWPTIRLVLDAKYRLDGSPAYVKAMGSPGPPQDAVNVLHRYRDAILERETALGSPPELKRTVVEGAALFPYCEPEPGSFQASRLWESLERLGIGAIPFLPQETGYVGHWLESVLKRSGWAFAQRVIPHASRQRLTEWRQAASEVVLVGVLRGGSEQQHLDWIQSNRRYYTRMTPTQTRQYATRTVALYSPTALRSRGAVTHVAEVEGIEVIPRYQIPTPWPASRPDELQVVYRLGELRTLDQPIENLGLTGQATRFSINRWTSRLGLQRARELRELFLETEPEWQLYEELHARRVSFGLEPGRPILQVGDDPRGRSWFVTDQGRAQYRGEAGWVLAGASQHQRYESSFREVVSFFYPDTSPI